MIKESAENSVLGSKNIDEGELLRELDQLEEQ